MVLRIFILLIFVFVVEAYAFQVVRVLTKIKWVQYSYLVISFGLLAVVFYIFAQHDRTSGDNHLIYNAIGILLMLLVPKLVVVFFLMIEDLFRLILWFLKTITKAEALSELSLNRRRIFSLLGLIIAAIPFFGFIHGILFGKYNYKVKQETIHYHHLPKAFDGFRILQISDIHVGSFKDPEKVKKGIDLINQQDYDVLLFTGDLVNNLAKELDGWESVFKAIKTPRYGKFSVIGNHDFGDYYPWNNDTIAKAKNFEALIENHKKIDFELLQDKYVWLEKDNQKSAIVGVNNWGYRFHQVGDLDQAMQGLTKEDFKILLSHDPSHWEYQVRHHPQRIDLTLSGHTHGMQFGIDWGNYFKWSPVQYVYKYWAGLYEHEQKYLYVNRGFGFHAYPGRVGIFPEITVLELRVK